MAKKVKTATAGQEPRKARRVPRRLIQWNWTLQATTAGAVKERRPEMIPMRKAARKT
jgi:hypothetical protein